MDGRVDLVRITGVPMGALLPFRSMGGKFRAWWPGLHRSLEDWVEATIQTAHVNCVLVTYHYSASDPSLGCGGWDNDTGAAKRAAQELAEDIRYTFDGQVFTVVAGVETDKGILELHGSHGSFSGLQAIDLGEIAISKRIQRICPNFPQEVAHDLVPLLMGNAQHLSAINGDEPDAINRGHQETAAAVGERFDWWVAATPRKVIIIHKSVADLSQNIHKASSILHSNLQSLPPDKTIAFVTNIPYGEQPRMRRSALLRTVRLQEDVQAIVRDNHRELWCSGRLVFMASILRDSTRRMTVIWAGSIDANGERVNAVIPYEGFPFRG